MHFNWFRVFLGHVLAIQVYVSFIVSESHTLQSIAHCYGSDAKIRLYCGLVLSVLVEIPLADESTLVAKNYGAFIGVQGCAIDRFVVFVLLHYVFALHIKNPEASILTGSIDQLIFLAKTADCVYVAFEGCFEGTNWGRRFGDVEYLDCVVHPDDYFIFAISDLEADGG